MQFDESFLVGGILSFILIGVKPTLFRTTVCLLKNRCINHAPFGLCAICTMGKWAGQNGPFFPEKRPKWPKNGLKHCKSCSCLQELFPIQDTLGKWRSLWTADWHQSIRLMVTDFQDKSRNRWTNI